ncbi:MAG: permease [Bacillota bacterium]
MMKVLKRYSFFAALLLINILIIIFFPSIGGKSIQITWDNTLEMLSVVPPIFILLGLLDVWVKRETMIKIMGEKSRLIGIVIAFVLGSAAAGPLYAAFPVAGMLMKKGSKFSNVLIFIGAWSTTKIPMLLFEASSMGWKFMLLRFAIDLPVIAAIAYMTQKLLKKSEIDEIYIKAENMA